MAHDGISINPQADRSARCPDGLLPDGEICPRCGGRRGPSGVEGGTWVHYPASPDPEHTRATEQETAIHFVPEVEVLHGPWIVNPSGVPFRLRVVRRLTGAVLEEEPLGVNGPGPWRASDAYNFAIYELIRLSAENKELREEFFRSQEHAQIDAMRIAHLEAESRLLQDEVEAELHEEKEKARGILQLTKEEVTMLASELDTKYGDSELWINTVKKIRESVR